MRVQGKVEALNRAINEAIPHMRIVARENPQASIFVNAICFADEARWMGEKLMPVSEFRWHDIEAGGATALGEALTMVGDVLQTPLLTDHGLPPVIVLVTDGLPTDDFYAGLDHLLSKPWGRQAVRVVVAVGEDSTSEAAQNFFRAFTENDTIQPFQANNPEALIEVIRRVSTSVLKSVASPLSRNADVVEGDSTEDQSSSIGIENETTEKADIW